MHMGFISLNLLISLAAIAIFTLFMYNRGYNYYHAGFNESNIIKRDKIKRNNLIGFILSVIGLIVVIYFFITNLTEVIHAFS